jgi:hypothetical protein
MEASLAPTGAVQGTVFNRIYALCVAAAIVQENQAEMTFISCFCGVECAPVP